MWMVSGLVMELLVMELLEFGPDSYRDWNLVIGIYNKSLGIYASHTKLEPFLLYLSPFKKTNHVKSTISKAIYSLL